MRRRLVVGTIAVIVVVLTVLVPAVVTLLRRAAERELEVRLSSQASAVSTAIADELLAGQAPTAEMLSRVAPPGDVLVILDGDGNELFRYGAAAAPLVTGTAIGPAGTVVEVATSRSELDSRIRGPILALAAFALGSIVVGGLLAWVVAGRLNRPLERLAASATRLGAGDFSAAVPPPSGIAEIDRISSALDSSAHRLDQMLTAERSFTGDATHQLRTGLAGVGLQLDLIASHDDLDVRAAAAQARSQVDRLTQTLDELLALARGLAVQRTTFDIADIVEHHVADWRTRLHAVGRDIVLHDASLTVRATPGFVGQILDILLDNALTHGAGLVTVDIGDHGVRIGDEGAIPAHLQQQLFIASVPPTASHGRGLVLARRLAQADGGRLELAAGMRTTFVLSYQA